MRWSVDIAASSQRLASSAAPCASMSQGKNSCRSRAASAGVARSSASGRPAAGSSAVKRAMSKAARTVCFSASGEKSELLALPRRWPT